MANQLFERMQIRGLVDGWARLALERWRKELRKQKIGVTDDLYFSFEHQLIRDKEELIGVILKFNYYGRFLDMGVGRGMKAYERGINKRMRTAVKRYGANVDYSERTPKRWFNKPKMSQIYRLQELLAEHMMASVTTGVTQAVAEHNDFIISIDG